MISGATGALAVVMVHLVSKGNAMGLEGENLGLYYLFLTVIFMGIFHVSRSFQTREICAVNTTPSNDGICKWTRHSYLPVSTRNVQKQHKR